jgi:outer membrane protein OmpA-like peptidoglycan-associated protein
MSATGRITGTILGTAAVGVYLFSVSASATGYVTQTYVYSFEIRAASGTTTVVGTDVKTIEFTDLTLVAGIKGSAYDDFVAARAVLNGGPDGHTVTYSISPSLGGLGLSMDTAGRITGTISSTAPAGVYLFSVSANAPGYVSQTFVYSFEVKAASVPYVGSGTGTSPGTGNTLPTTAKSLKFDVNFAPGSSKISTADQKRVLLLVSKIVKKVTSGQVVGYVQTTNYSSNDLKLSLTRAKVMSKFLSDHGIKVRLTTSGKGALSSSSKARKITATLNYLN